MNFRRVRAIARKEFLHVLRDPRSLGMAIGIPMLMLVLFGYALTLDVDNVPLVVWDQSDTPASRELVSRFTGSRYFSLRRLRRRLSASGPGDRHRRGLVGLVIPRTFAQDVAAGRTRRCKCIVDGSDSNTATIAIGYAEALIAANYSQDMTDRGSSSGRARPARGDAPGRAAAGLVQRRPGVEELHRPRPDRRDHDGHRRAADLADRRPGVGARHDGAAHLHAGHAAAS